MIIPGISIEKVQGIKGTIGITRWSDYVFLVLNYIASEKQGETYFISQAVSTEMMTVMVTMETAVVTAMEEDRSRVSSPIFSA